MEPISTAVGISLILGLVQLFHQEWTSEKQATKADFIQWLEHHRHEEVKRLIVENHALGSEIENLLQGNHKEVMARFDGLEEMLSPIISAVARKTVPGFFRASDVN